MAISYSSDHFEDSIITLDDIDVWKRASNIATSMQSGVTFTRPPKAPNKIIKGSVRTIRVYEENCSIFDIVVKAPLAEYGNTFTEEPLIFTHFDVRGCRYSIIDTEWSEQRSENLNVYVIVENI